MYPRKPGSIITYFVFSTFLSLYSIRPISYINVKSVPSTSTRHYFSSDLIKWIIHEYDTKFRDYKGLFSREINLSLLFSTLLNLPSPQRVATKYSFGDYQNNFFIVVFLLEASFPSIHPLPCCKTVFLEQNLSDRYKVV